MGDIGDVSTRKAWSQPSSFVSTLLRLTSPLALSSARFIGVVVLNSPSSDGDSVDAISPSVFISCSSLLERNSVMPSPAATQGVST